MQEKLLRLSVSDRDVNLEKYKDTVKQIDEFYFSNLLSEIEQVSEHNQTLEEELEFLEQISSTYEQVLVEQVKFRNVCELYGDNSLILSDLSRIDKEYIDSRKNAISGYLINKKNIEDSKKKLDLLSGQLRDEEKNNNLLKKRLLEFEEVLRNNFINAEGRYLNDLKLEYVSVISEYKKLGYDFKELLRDTDKIEEILSGVYNEINDSDDKLKTAELCYNRIPSVESKNILDEINLENIRVKYKLTMLKILDLLSKDIDNYDMFLKKRKDLFDLIKYRLDYIKKLGINVSIDPFNRTKVFDQIKVVEALDDNSKNIYKVRKAINELNSRLEEMIAMRNSYKDEINDVRDILINVESEELVEDTSMNDIVMSNVGLDVKWEANQYFEDKVTDEKIVLENQIVDVRDISSEINMEIVNQKTSSVIKRVNEMVNGVFINDDSKNEDVSPELVIEQVSGLGNDMELFNNSENEVKLDNSNAINVGNIFSVDDVDEEVVLELDNTDDVDDKIAELVEKYEDKKNDVLPLFSLPEDMDINNVFIDDINKVENTGIDDEVVSVDDTSFDDDMFMTVDPFVDAPLFADKVDDVDRIIQKNNKQMSFSVIDDLVMGEKFNINDNENRNSLLENEDLSNLEVQDELEEQMPDVFWTVQDEGDSLKNGVNDEINKVVLSFDEQVALLRDGEKGKSKILKLESNNEIDKKVA